MEKDKLIEIVENVKDKSNKDLIESMDLLMNEFYKTKELIVDLTKHLEAVEYCYEAINREIGKRIS
jgi:hypothetical protein